MNRAGIGPWLLAMLALGLASCATAFNAREQTSSEPPICGNGPNFSRFLYNPDTEAHFTLPPFEDPATGVAKVFFTKGDVNLVNKEGTRTDIFAGEPLSDGDTVTVSGGETFLVFSNGITIRAGDTAAFKIDQFTQEKFASPTTGSFLNLTRDPSRSTTQIDLVNAVMMLEVKPLNATNGSTLILHCPVGEFTTEQGLFVVCVIRDANGVVNEVTATSLSGILRFSPLKFAEESTQFLPGINQPVEIPAGGQIRILPGPNATTGTTNASSVLGMEFPREESAKLIAAYAEFTKSPSRKNIAAPEPHAPNGIPLLSRAKPSSPESEAFFY